MQRSVDRAYWDDVFYVMYIDGRFGSYEEAYRRFVVAHPEYLDWCRDHAVDREAQECVKRIAARFNAADRAEHEHPPATPPHLRQGFLLFDMEVPPLSPSIVVEGGHRLAAEDASPKQHRKHHRKLKLYHRRGYAYRKVAEAGWVALMTQIKARLPQTESLDDHALREIMKMLEAALVEV